MNDLFDDFLCVLIDKVMSTPVHSMGHCLMGGGGGGGSCLSPARRKIMPGVAAAACANVQIPQMIWAVKRSNKKKNTWKHQKVE